MDFFDLDSSSHLKSFGLTTEQETALKSKDADTIGTVIKSLTQDELHKLCGHLAIGVTDSVRAVAETLSLRFRGVGAVSIVSSQAASQVDSLMGKIVKEVGTLDD